MVKPVINNHGILDKFIGDAIMAVFKTNSKVNNSAINALKTAEEMVMKIRALNRFRSNSNDPEINIDIGINTGEVIAGNIGSSERMEYTFIGDAVNIASRIEGLNKIYKTSIIVSESTYKFAGNKSGFNFRELDVVFVKGKNKPIKVYKLLT